MKEDQALALIDQFLKAHGLEGSEEGPEDDSDLEDEAGEWEPELAFRFYPETGVLKAWAPIYEFQDPPLPGVLEACQAEAKLETTPKGGGTLEYDPKDQGLYLTRSYTEAVPVAQLSGELRQLQEAAEQWGEEVMERVAVRVFPQTPQAAGRNSAS